MNRYSKHPEVDGIGWFIIDHIPTGKVYVNTSVCMRKDIDKLFEGLSSGDRSYKKLSKLYAIEPHFKVTVHPTKSISEAKKQVKGMLVTLPTYLLLN